MVGSYLLFSRVPVSIIHSVQKSNFNVLIFQFFLTQRAGRRFPKYNSCFFFHLLIYIYCQFFCLYRHFLKRA